MTQLQFDCMLTDLIEAANELKETELGFPNDRDSFMRVMWQDNQDMKARGATREEYTDALHEAYAIITRPNYTSK